jgi:hypothetical protein
MARFISFLAAIVVLLSASTEIASFAIDHQSWLQENYNRARDYLATWAQPEPAAPKRCDTACPPPALQAEAPRCDTIEPLGKKVLCYLTIPKADNACPKDCEQKGKPPLPPDWIRSGKKSGVASAGQPQ